MMKKDFKICLIIVTTVLLAITNHLSSEPIPAPLLFPTSQREDIQLSPNGEKVSYIFYDQNRIKNIFIKTIGKNDDKPMIEELDGDIISHYWSFLPDKILFNKMTEDKKAIHLYSYDINTKIIRDLTPFKGINVKFLITDHRKPEEIACGIELNKKGRYDLYSINLLSGALAELTKVPEDTVDIKGDLNNKVFITESIDRKSLKRIFKVKTLQSDKFYELATVDATTDFRVVDFSEDGKYLYIISNKTNKYSVLLKYDIEQNKEIERIAESQKSDIDHLFFNKYSKKPISVAYDFMKREYSVLDPQVNEDLQILSKNRKGNITILANDIKNEKWLISYETADTPPSFYIYNRNQKKSVLLFVNIPELEKYKISKNQPFTIKFGEDEKILLFVTLPNEQEIENFPLILNLFNPENRKRGITFDPICQFFSSRGFACISFNYTGIKGLGRDSYNSIFSKEGIKRRINEITTVIKWAIDRNIANPQQIILLSDTFNSLYSLSTIAENSELIQTAIFIEPLFFKSKKPKENLDLFTLFNTRELSFMPLDERKEAESQIFKITMPAIFVINKQSNIYDHKEILEILSEAKKKNKEITIISHTDSNINNLTDIYQHIETLLAKYYNTDYIQAQEKTKNNIEIW